MAEQKQSITDCDDIIGNTPAEKLQNIEKEMRECMIKFNEIQAFVKTCQKCGQNFETYQETELMCDDCLLCSISKWN